MRNELRIFTHKISVMIRRFEGHPSPPVVQDSGSHPIVPHNEITAIVNQNVPTPSIQINILQSMPSDDHWMCPSLKKRSPWEFTR